MRSGAADMKILQIIVVPLALVVLAVGALVTLVEITRKPQLHPDKEQ